MRARLDQHFLIDRAVRDAIVAAARLVTGDRVVEIGPGRGFLTRELVARADVTAVEMDERLAESLARSLEGVPHFRLIRADFLDVDPSALGGPPLKFVANLPYSVATPILQRVLGWDTWPLAVLMFQKEVADRILAGPGSRDYGLLSLSVAIKATARVVAVIGPRGFSPAPKVDSAVVVLHRLPKPLVAPEREQAFFSVARAAFSQRRKTAANALAAGLRLERTVVEEALASCGVAPMARAEDIALEAFLALATALEA